jgi:SRSO17 transposase
VALRVTPAHDWRARRLAPEVWLLAERDTGDTPQTKYSFVHLPASASRRQLVRLAHQRWAIEQQYRELKTDLGLDHFEGRTFPGWHHHVVLTAITYNFLQAERRRHLASLAPEWHRWSQERRRRPSSQNSCCDHRRRSISPDASFFWHRMTF